MSCVFHYLPSLLLLLLFCTNCGDDSATAPPGDEPTSMPQLTSAAFGTVPGQGPATLYTLTNDAGNSVKITDYGGIVTSINYDGAEMTVAFDDLAPYLDSFPYYGALIGRYGNRIADARFTLDGTTYDLVPNEKGNQLHGGTKGFDKYIWRADTNTTADAAVLTLRHTSPDGDMGFPGKLDVKVTYTWTNDNELKLDYEATTDEPTIVNLTNHTYFNISDADTMTAVVLQLDADAYTPVDEELIPFGKNEPVAGTPFDFRAGKPIGQDIRSDHSQVKQVNGYDHNWVLNNYDGSLRQFATLTDPVSGRRLTCSTTEPGLQIFTTNFTPGQFPARGGEPVKTYEAICLETQHFPDSPNQEGFATPRLDVGETYRTTTVYHFSKGAGL